MAQSPYQEQAKILHFLSECRGKVSCQSYCVWHQCLLLFPPQRGRIDGSERRLQICFSARLFVTDTARIKLRGTGLGGYLRVSEARQLSRSLTSPGHRGITVTQIGSAVRLNVPELLL